MHIRNIRKWDMNSWFLNSESLWNMYEEPAVKKHKPIIFPFFWIGVMISGPAGMIFFEHWTDCSRGNAPDSYSGGARFEDPTGHLLSLLRFFVIFPQYLHANSLRVPRLGEDRFLPDPFHFIIHSTVRRFAVSTMEASLNNPNKTHIGDLWENLALRTIFGYKRDYVSGYWRKLHNEKVRNL